MPGNSPAEIACVSLWPAISTVMRHLLHSCSCSIPKILWGAHNSRGGMMMMMKGAGKERGRRRRESRGRTRGEKETKGSFDGDRVTWTYVFLSEGCSARSLNPPPSGDFHFIPICRFISHVSGFADYRLTSLEGKEGRVRGFRLGTMHT